MIPIVRAIYEAGQLRLLDPVNLNEGDQVEVIIQKQEIDSIDARLKASGLLLDVNIPDDALTLSDAERDRIGKLFAEKKR